ncbi:alpha/beta hydrolase family protein [Aestuariivita boseongensis]|uniref:alpha/beta hydrolase family protein n=1 Tax=Aestuariivita boseongensis TaxID=1470562 RepID=UPI000681A1DC|nr:alpha/beta hydrolase [Aestuariivita boseongensis]
MLDANSSDLIQVVPVTFPSGSTELSGTLFLPSGPPRAALVLNGATGVPQRFYRHFARWLASDQKIACLTFDYDGMGTSATGHVRDSHATMLNWALRDQPAARAALRDRIPGVPLWVLGHSLGAMLLPMQDDIDDIEHVFAVASGYVHHSDHPWPYQGLARLFWFGHAPLIAGALGYLPGKRLGFGEDLPPGVYWEWRKWCTSKSFFWPDVGDTIPKPKWTGAPVRLVSFADDSMMPSRCTWRLERSFGAEACSRVVLDPSDAGLSSVGHVAGFAPQNAAIWPHMLGEAVCI